MLERPGHRRHPVQIRSHSPTHRESPGFSQVLHKSLTNDVLANDLNPWTPDVIDSLNKAYNAEKVVRKSVVKVNSGKPAPRGKTVANNNTQALEEKGGAGTKIAGTSTGTAAKALGGLVSFPTHNFMSLHACGGRATKA